jgi:glycosyltransferase involved in cell wall biosynthesis
MHILHAITPGAVGGLESVVRALVAGHAGRGHQVTVAAVVDPEPGPHPLLVALEQAGATVTRIPARGRRYLQERRTLLEEIAGRKPDVVHTHGYRSDVLAGSAARAAGIPTLTTVHGFTGGDLKNRLYEHIQLMAFRRADAVVAVSRPLEATLRQRGVPADRLVLLPNAWSPGGAPCPRDTARATLGLAGERFVAGWVGRISGEKGLDVFLRAMTDPPLHDVEAVVIGEGRERTACEALARSLGIAGRVTWSGMVPDAGRLVTAFDAFVLSSRTEGTPITLFEAMAAGVPVVATAVGGVPDVAGDTALLVPPEDPALLAGAIAAVRREPQPAAARAGAARRRLQERYDTGPWLEAYETLYSRLASRAGAGRP